MLIYFIYLFLFGGGGSVAYKVLKPANLKP